MDDDYIFVDKCKLFDDLYSDYLALKTPKKRSVYKLVFMTLLTNWRVIWWITWWIVYSPFLNL